MCEFKHLVSFNQLQLLSLLLYLLSHGNLFKLNSEPFWQNPDNFHLPATKYERRNIPNTPFYRKNSLRHFKWFNQPPKKEICKYIAYSEVYLYHISSRFHRHVFNSFCYIITLRIFSMWTNSYMHNWIAFNPLNYFKALYKL